ncbi:MAG: hypothetical protein MI861_09100, partial [Pirellulales bacterium]|nr:hypothetical protein [Pirellulales bacterium]
KRLRAASGAAQAMVMKTEADVDLLKTQQRSAAAVIAASEAALEETKGKKSKAVAVVDDLKVQVNVAQREYNRIEQLAQSDAASQSDVDRTEIQLTGLKSQLKSAEVDVRVSDDTIARAQADVSAARAASQAVDLQLKQLVETELPRVRAQALEAELAANSMVGSEHTLVASAKAALAKAQYDLEQTTIEAPADGYAIGVTLRPGQRVGNLPIRSWMSFVTAEDTTLGVGVPQYALRHVRPGQKAEVTLKLYPGQIFSATVDEIAYVNPQGQLQASGAVMNAPGANQIAVPFGVRLKLDDETELDLHQLPGGSVGKAAIYTDKMKGTHLIRRVMIRMDAWLNYVKPW